MYPHNLNDNMKKNKTETKVTKQLVRNCEQIVKPNRVKVVPESGVNTKSTLPKKSIKENELSHPSLCSSSALANYLSEIHVSAPSPLAIDDANVKNEIYPKLTKKLNFHLNDKIYKNLIELNTSIDNVKSKKEKRLISKTSSKRDLVPNIEDFYQDEMEYDNPPEITVMRPKFKPIRKVEDGSLHKLISRFEDL